MKLIYLSITSILFALILNFSVTLQATQESSKTLKNASFFLPIEEIHPGQSRIASKHVELHVQKAIKIGWASRAINSSSLSFKFDDGKSAYPIEKAYPVILSPFGYVLVNGHHHISASLSMNAKTVPVTIIADYTSLSEAEFWIEAEERGFVYLKNIHAEYELPPRKLIDLQDDPNRYFASLVVLKITDESYIAPEGTPYPIWIKTANEIPFLELKIADVLTRYGFSYNYEVGDILPDDLVEQARTILIEANIPNLKVINSKINYRDFKVNH